MSADRTTGLLLSLYPAGWRARYGEELEALILETSAGRVSWHVRLDVAVGGGRERLHAAGLGGGDAPAERMRGGALLVLCAWALFVVAGVGVQKFSEHWQAVTPSADRALPAHAFDVLVVAAAIGSALIAAGVAATLPSLAGCPFRKLGRAEVAARRSRLDAGRCPCVCGCCRVGAWIVGHRAQRPRRRLRGGCRSLGSAARLLSCGLDGGGRRGRGAARALHFGFAGGGGTRGGGGAFDGCDDGGDCGLVGGAGTVGSVVPRRGAIRHGGLSVCTGPARRGDSDADRDDGGECGGCPCRSWV